MYIADLHIHSSYSRATSRDCDAPHLDWWARRKGIQVVGTGDFTHPAWRAALREQLEPAEEGLYTLREGLRLPGTAPGARPRFVVTGEISSIYKRGGRTRKVHDLILLPSLEAADELSARLEAIGNIRSDGRPILGLDSRDLLELTLETCPEAELIPAHIWTPHFAMFGAFSGFDTVEECFGDLARHIHAVETGLSSDPPMNWRVSALDRFTLVSHSDAHSPGRLGREADLLDTGLSYPELLEAIRTGEGFLGTVEFFPEEGKYHLDGHRKCGVCLTPAQAAQREDLCPVCGKKLTIGVEHRVEELSDRPEGQRPEGAKPFESLAPLPEVIAASTGRSPGSKWVAQQYEGLLAALGTEFAILREVPVEEIRRAAGPCVAEGIRRLRLGQVERRPGFDGEYGSISLLAPAEIAALSGQLSLFASGPEAGERPTPAGTGRRKSGAATKEGAPSAPAGALDAAQRAAAAAPEPRVAVVAGPGTGKTKTLVGRIAYLMEELGARPEEITAVTFTRQAAQELRQRLESGPAGKRGAARLHIGTFHALCLELLGEDVRLISRGDALTAAAQVLQELGGRGSPRRLLQAVSQVKNGRTPEQAGISRALFDGYADRLKAMGALDYDDLLTEALGRDVTGRRAFTHLLVDEFQDINDAQYRLVRAWSGAGKTLFVIGDPDQAIYGFRGADPGCFQRLLRDQPDTRVVRLEESYRSTPEVLAAALAVVEAGPGGERILRPVRGHGPAVRLVQAEDELREGAFIAGEIGRMTGGVDMLAAQALDHEGEARAFSDIAVLCRTHRQLEQVERCLRREDIPCVVVGREDFLESDKVRGALSFLRSVQDPGDIPALETALRLLFDCPADLFPAIEAAASRREPLAALEAASSGRPHLERWLERAALWRPAVEEEAPWRLVQRWEEAYGAAPELEKLRNTAVFYDSLEALWTAASQGEEADLRRAAGTAPKGGAVQLMTLHGAKGLEFPAVFVAGAREGRIPLEAGERETDLEEERRLFYVGMTRAKDELILTYSGRPSPFLAALPQGTVRKEAARARPRPAEQLRLF